jgi:hypothetical protein
MKWSSSFLFLKNGSSSEIQTQFQSVLAKPEPELTVLTHQSGHHPTLVWTPKILKHEDIVSDPKMVGKIKMMAFNQSRINGVNQDWNPNFQQEIVSDPPQHGFGKRK